jgi:beta-glucosidase
LQANKPDGVELEYALGAYTAKFLPTFDLELFSAPSSGKPGFDLSHYPIVDGKQAAKPAVAEVWTKSDMFLADFHHPDLVGRYWSEIKSTFTSPIDGEYEFALAVTGHGRLWVDDELVVDTKGQKKGSAYFNCGTEEKRGKYKVQKGKVRRFTGHIHYEKYTCHRPPSGNYVQGRALTSSNTPFACSTTPRLPRRTGPAIRPPS